MISIYETKTEMSKVFVDTSAWIAYFSHSDINHNQVSRIIRSEMDEGSIVCTSNYIFDETVTRLIYDTSWYYASRFIDFVRRSVAAKSLVMVWVDDQVEADALEILEKFHEHKISLTDATSAVFVKRLGIERILTLDSDFAKIGIPVLP